MTEPGTADSEGLLGFDIAGHGELLGKIFLHCPGNYDDCQMRFMTKCIDEAATRLNNRSANYHLSDFREGGCKGRFHVSDRISEPERAEIWIETHMWGPTTLRQLDNQNVPFTSGVNRS